MEHPEKPRCGSAADSAERDLPVLIQRLRQVESAIDESLGGLALAGLLHGGAAAAELVTAAVAGRLGSPSDLRMRRIDYPSGQRLVVIYLQTLVGADPLERSLLFPLMQNVRRESPFNLGMLRNAVLANQAVTSVHSLDQLAGQVLRGNAIIYLEGAAGALAVDVSSPPHRGVEEPNTESVIHGPRDGFTEDLKTNLGLLRARLRSERLRIHTVEVGKVAPTDMALTYLEGIARPELILEARRRLAGIDIDAVLDSGYVAELIEDNPLSVFPSIASTERPDRVAAGLLEGYAAILVAGSPFALLVPGRLDVMLQSPDDYYTRYPIAILTRVLRSMALAITGLLTATYVAVTTFHPQLLPAPIFLSFAAAREGVPLPPWAEAMLMEGAFELLREAGARMPRTVGQTVSIVGVLVVGQAAVSAHIVSPIIIVIVGTTAIAAFAVPDVNLSGAIRLLRFPAIIVAATFGLYGLTLAALAVLLEILHRETFGAPFVTRGVISTGVQRWKDTWVRLPWWLMIRRPRQVPEGQSRRQPAGQMPPE